MDPRKPPTLGIEQRTLEWPQQCQHQSPLEPCLVKTTFSANAYIWLCMARSEGGWGHASCPRYQDCFQSVPWVEEIFSRDHEWWIERYTEVERATRRYVDLQYLKIISVLILWQARAKYHCGTLLSILLQEWTYKQCLVKKSVRDASHHLYMNRF